MGCSKAQSFSSLSLLCQSFLFVILFKQQAPHLLLACTFAEQFLRMPLSIL
jgi:hypothetical protein